ncbi:MAG: DUF362 domain-containing protein [Candidatus Schekmanbacteria bacterium]|nr:MAG: DUF362 domain-containing protein [Candidatus Schekmanbacteria bacterium]
MKKKNNRFNIFHFFKSANRRDFIKDVSIAAFGLMVSGTKIVFSDEIKKMPAHKSIVGMARDGSVKKTLRKAVELSGGLDFIKPGDKVLLKPNNNANVEWPGSTNPEVVYELVNLVREKEPSRIIVSDRSTMALDTLKAMKASKIYDAAMDAKAEVITGEQRKYRKVKPPMAVNWPQGFHISEIIDEVDHIINIPQPKAHWITGYTMGFKNYVGLIDVPDRMEYLHKGLQWKVVGDEVKPVQPIEPISAMIPEISLAVKTSLTVLDATRSIVEGSSDKGKVETPGIIAASRDQIAIDVVGLAIMKSLGASDFIQIKPIWEQLQIKRAVELGLGAKSGQEIDLKSSGISEIEKIRSFII